MTVSTSLLFSRGVSLMGSAQAELAKTQEQVSTGKQVVRPSDSPDQATQISRLKTTMTQLDSYRSNLQSTLDRLAIEESYVGGAADVMIRMRELAMRSTNGSLNAADRQAVAMEVDQLIDELVNLANAADSDGKFLFGGSRNATPPYQQDEDGVYRYTGDIFKNEIDYTAQRRGSINRTGLEIFKAVTTGEFLSATNELQEIELRGSVEVGDIYTVSIDGAEFTHRVGVGETTYDIMFSLAAEIDAANQSGVIEQVKATVSANDTLLLEGLAGSEHIVELRALNTTESLKDESATIAPNGASTDTFTAVIDGSMEAGDRFTLGIGDSSFSYTVTGREGLSEADPASIGVDFLDLNGDSVVGFGNGDSLSFTLTDALGEDVDIQISFSDPLPTNKVELAALINQELTDSSALTAPKYRVYADNTTSNPGAIKIERADGLNFGIQLGVNDFTNGSVTALRETPIDLTVSDAEVETAANDPLTLIFADTAIGSGSVSDVFTAGDSFSLTLTDANGVTTPLFLDPLTEGTSTSIVARLNQALANSPNASDYLITEATNGITINHAGGLGFTSSVDDIVSYGATLGTSVVVHEQLDDLVISDTISQTSLNGLTATSTRVGSVRDAMVEAIRNDPTMSSKVAVVVDPDHPERFLLTTLDQTPGEVTLVANDRGDMNDQRLLVDRIQRALPARPETLEFFESVQQFSDMLKADDWESIQRKLPQLAQIIDSVTLAQADIGSDMRSIEAEVMVNEDLKINLQAALASSEDLDYTTAITKMQAQMLSLEAAQSSFAKISQLSLFDYIR